MDNDNKLMGVIGALIGAIVGIAVWCLLGKLGVIAWVGGFAICYGTLLGYHLLGKGVSVVGVIICAVIIIASVYLATRLNWTIATYSEFSKLGYDVSFTACFSNIIDLVELAECKADFIKDLVFGYVITVLSGFTAFKKLGR